MDYLKYLRFWPAALGFLVGAWISFLFMSPEPDAVERAMSLASAFVGAIAAQAAKMGTIPARRILALVGGLALCVVIGIAMIVYRWIVG
jgi:hypothetical protein